MRGFLNNVLLYITVISKGLVLLSTVINLLIGATAISYLNASISGVTSAWIARLKSRPRIVFVV